MQRCCFQAHRKLYLALASSPLHHCISALLRPWSCFPDLSKRQSTSALRQVPYPRLQGPKSILSCLTFERQTAPRCTRIFSRIPQASFRCRHQVSAFLQSKSAHPIPSCRYFVAYLLPASTIGVLLLHDGILYELLQAMPMPTIRLSGCAPHPHQDSSTPPAATQTVPARPAPPMKMQPQRSRISRCSESK